MIGWTLEGGVYLIINYMQYKHHINLNFSHNTLNNHHRFPQRQFAPLVAAAQLAGVHIDISSSKALADSLDLAVKKEDPCVNISEF